MCFLLSVFGADAQTIGIQHLSTYETGIFDDSGSEIVAYDPISQKVFSTNGSLNRVDMIDISNVNTPTLTGSIDLSTYGGGVQSLSIYNGVIAVAVEAISSGTDPGSVVFFDNTGTYLSSVSVGALPDMVAFGPNGNYVLTANEGEPDDNYTIDPLGSVSVIDMSAGAQNLTQSDVTTLDFSAYNGQTIPGLRVYGPNASFAQDMEPEYVAFNATGTEAYVILQENNGVAKIDLTGTPSIASVSGLGYKDWSSYQLDASNRSSAIDFRSFDNLFGMYQPDAIKSVSYGSKSYIVTANEGDSRDYDGYSEEDRVEDLALDTVAFPSASALQDEELLGRLKITTSMGDTDSDGFYEEIYSYGGRSFSIVDPATGRIVYDSGDMIEQMVAQLEPAYFNSNNDDNSSFKSRSDDKGPEPEAIEVATVGGNTYAFVGLERHGGIMCFNISDTANVTFEFFYNNRNWSMPENAPGVGDLGPEDLKFIPAASSPNGKDLLLLSAEVSGTVSLYEVGANVGSTTLSILHNNDGESQLINAGSGIEDFGGVARFKTLIDNMRSSATSNGRAHLTLSSGDNFLAGPEFSAGLNRASGPLYDAIALAAIDYDAICLGNHDFDFGPGLLADFINDVNGINPTPYLSANLDMSTEPALSGLASNGDIASSTIVNKGGEQIGIVGATTSQLNNISSPGQITIDTDVASAVQNEIDNLMGQGVDKIILISHLQGIDEDTALIAQLTGVDVVIAGGGSELLGDTTTALVPGDGPIYGTYPMTKTDASGRTVYMVTTPGEYKYVGQLNLTFNSSGEVSSIDAGSGLYRVGSTNVSGGVASDSLLQSNVVDSVSAYVADLASNIIATSEVELDGRRNSVRGMETNEGNMIADAMLWQANKNAASFGAPNADIGIQNGGGIRNNNLIAAGPISELNTFDMLPFSNFVTIVEDITPDRFKEMMENSVSRITGNGPSGGGTGRFAQIAGFSIVMDSAATALSYDVNGNIVQAGSRIIEIQLDNGTYIVQNGQVIQGAPNVNLAVADFTAKGGDQYPIGDLNRTLVGATYQQALFNYITAADGLNGLIDSTQYPEGGSGRYTVGANVGSTTLSILHNNDGESQLINAGSGIEDFGGVARFKTLIDNMRSSATSNGRAHLTLSSGDNFLAGPEFSAGLNRASGPLYDAIALAAIDYDAICLGNHDFDFGPGLLADFINDVNGINPTPYLSANLDMSTEPALSGLASNGDIASSTIVNKGGEQIGIVGATTSQLNNISSPGQITIDTDVASAVQNEIDNLMGQGVDKIILISHLQGIDEDTALIAQLTGVDVVIAGGGSELLGDTTTALVPGDGPIYGTYPMTKTDASGRTVYMVTTPGEYKYVGQLNLTFNSSGEVSSIDAGSGLYRVGSTNVSGGVASDSLLQSNVVDSVSAYVADLASNIIATSEVELDGRRNSVRGMETNEGNMIADAMLWQANKNAASFGAPNADIGIQNGGGIRNNNLIAAGPISELNTFDMLPFSNFVTIVEDITPDRFKEMMENSVSRITGNGPSGGGTGRFAQIAGFSIVMDSAATALSYDVNGNIVQAGSRIIEIQLDNGTYIVQNGQVIQGAPNVNLAVADFTAKGGDQYPIGDLNRTLVGATYQQALFNYITAADGLNGLIDSTQYPEGGSGRIGYGTANLCADVIDSVQTINSGKGIYRVWFNNPMPTATSYSLEWKPDTATTWRSKSLKGANQAWKGISTSPWFNSDIDVRVVMDDAGSISYSCEEQFNSPCRPMTLQTAQQIAPRCPGDSVLLRVGIAGGTGAKTILWSNGATTKRTFAAQGQTLTVTVTDASGCSENASATAGTLLNTLTAPSNVVTSRTGTVVTVNWNASNLGSGQSLIGYRVQYRLRGTNSWTQIPLTTNTTADVDFSGGVAGNYDFTVLARYIDNGAPVSSARACFAAQGVPVTKNGVAMGDADAADIAVYPNPTRSQIYVSAPSGSEISLMDLSGRIIAVQTVDQSEASFDLKEMSNGIYLIQIKDNGELTTKRVIKQ